MFDLNALCRFFEYFAYVFAVIFFIVSIAVFCDFGFLMGVCSLVSTVLVSAGLLMISGIGDAIDDIRNKTLEN